MLICLSDTTNIPSFNCLYSCFMVISQQWCLRHRGCYLNWLPDPIHKYSLHFTTGDSETETWMKWNEYALLRICCKTEMETRSMITLEPNEQWIKIDERHHWLRFWFWGRITERAKKRTSPIPASYFPPELIKTYHLPFIYTLHFWFVHSKTMVDFLASVRTFSAVTSLWMSYTCCQAPFVRAFLLFPQETPL